MIEMYGMDKVLTESIPVEDMGEWASKTIHGN
jgi:hypothetical protein